MKAIKSRVLLHYHHLKYKQSTGNHPEEALPPPRSDAFSSKMTAFPLIFVKRGAAISEDRDSEWLHVKACSSLPLHQVQLIRCQHLQKIPSSSSHRTAELVKSALFCPDLSRLIGRWRLRQTECDKMLVRMFVLLYQRPEYNRSSCGDSHRSILAPRFRRCEKIKTAWFSPRFSSSRRRVALTKAPPCFQADFTMKERRHGESIGW